MALSDARPNRRPEGDVGGATTARDGPPPITQITFPTCCSHYLGGSEQVHLSVASLSHAAFPEPWAGRHPHLHFRGLLRLYSRYGPLGCSTAQSGLCRKAPDRPVAQSIRLPATRSNRQLSVWHLPPLVICAFGAHVGRMGCGGQVRVCVRLARRSCSLVIGAVSPAAPHPTRLRRATFPTSWRRLWRHALPSASPCLGRSRQLSANGACLLTA